MDIAPRYKLFTVLTLLTLPSLPTLLTLLSLFNMRLTVLGHFETSVVTLPVILMEDKKSWAL